MRDPIRAFESFPIVFSTSTLESCLIIHIFLPSTAGIFTVVKTWDKWLDVEYRGPVQNIRIIKKKHIVLSL